MSKAELIVEVKFHRRNNLALKNKSTTKFKRQIITRSFQFDITLSMVMNK